MTDDIDPRHDISDEAMVRLLRNDPTFRYAYDLAASLEDHPVTDTERLNRAARLAATNSFREREEAAYSKMQEWLDSADGQRYREVARKIMGKHPCPHDAVPVKDHHGVYRCPKCDVPERQLPNGAWQEYQLGTPGD